MSFRSKLARFEAMDESSFATATAISTPTATATRTSTWGHDPRAATLDDLRARIHAVIERTARRAPPSPRPVETSELPFLTHDTPLGPLHLRSYRLSPSHRTGHAPLLPARGASPELLALLALDPQIAACDPSRALYLDTETTGLHGGTGTIAFLVGLAFWEDTAASASSGRVGEAAGGGGLIVEQMLVRNLGEEAPMLERVAARIREASMLVTFNGKSFDIPLLRTRFVMARMQAPVEPPHLDLVHIARRLHKSRGIACRLTTLEREILGFERHDDVPSGEVSARYLHFLRTGDAQALLGVIEHNAWDVVSMASLVGHYGEPLEGSALAADDLVGVARTLLKAGCAERAFDVASLAIVRGAGHESYRARAEIAKARGDRLAALEDFETLAEKIDDGRVRLELAKLYEHYVKEPLRALDLVTRGTGERVDLAEKRTRRLTRKIDRAASRPQTALAYLPPKKKPR